MELQQNKQERVYVSSSIRRQTSAEIVSDARRALRTLATQRPVTPRDKLRQLFGTSSTRAHDGRPPSSFSLHSQNFKVSDSRPGSGAQLSPLDHSPQLPLDDEGGDPEDEAALPKPPADGRTVRAWSGGSRVRQLRAAALSRKTLQLDAPDVCAGATPEGNQRKESGKSYLPVPIRRRQAARISSSGKTAATSDRKLALEQSEESQFWYAKVLPVLQEFEAFTPGDGASEESVERLCEACAGLHHALAQRHWLGRQCKNRASVLRSLFKLIDVGSDRLNLSVANLILALKVSGNNLLNICKLVFKISQNATNDSLFLAGSIVDSLLWLLQCEDVWSCGEAVLYCVASLKLLSGNGALCRLLLDKHLVRTLLELSARLLRDATPTSGAEVIAGHILVQVTAALRNVADQSESRAAFLSTKAFHTLLWVLESHRRDVDVCINVSRILSKLSTYTECCHALAETPRCCPLLLQLLNTHGRKQDLVVRLLFTLGNLTAKSADARERIYREDGGIPVLLDLFRAYWREPEESHAPEGEDVLVKLVRLIANLAIHPAVGGALAGDAQCVQLLLEVLEKRCIEKSEELVINTIATINNLSFYQTQSSVVHARHQHISQLLLKLFLSSSMDGVLEATRVLGNLSQITEVRHFIMQRKVYPFVVTLLDSKNPDVCFSACGVLVNLSADPRSRATLRDRRTIQTLTDCLKDLGHQDWYLAAVACQTLWNCSLDQHLEHTEELLEILLLYSDRASLQWSSDADIRLVQETSWEMLFMPVATKLVQRLQTFS